jgi:hypothetical protein
MELGLTLKSGPESGSGPVSFACALTHFSRAKQPRAKPGLFLFQPTFSLLSLCRLSQLPHTFSAAQFSLPHSPFFILDPSSTHSSHVTHSRAADSTTRQHSRVLNPTASIDPATRAHFYGAHIRPPIEYSNTRPRARSPNPKITSESTARQKPATGTSLDGLLLVQSRGRNRRVASPRLRPTGPTSEEK